MDYRREIDGLRAVAVLPVILFHAGFAGFSGGFVGVDIFFVISGFLITSILIAERQAGNFSLVNFYERRARRILPALFFVLFACLPFAWMWLMPTELKSFSKSLVAVSGFASNILFWRESGYFETMTELKPLLHTWSLAVEEQYYLFFPLFLMLTWRLRQRWVIVVLAAAALASLAAAQWGSARPSSASAAFYLLPTRGWELLIGALIAYYLANQKGKAGVARAVAEPLGLLGLLLIAVAVFGFDRNTPFPSLYTLAPTLGAGLIILFSTQDTLVGRLLGNRALVSVGLVSYSAYLWHQPLFAFAKQRSLHEPGQLLLGGLALASLVLAYFSWKYVERPFRSKHGVNRRQIFTFAAVGSAFFVAIGVAGTVKHGFADRFDARQTASFNPPKTEFESRCVLTAVAGEPLLKGCAFGKADGKELFVLYGDSHAQALFTALDRALVQKGMRGMYVMNDACMIENIYDSRNKSGRQACERAAATMYAWLATQADYIAVAIRWTYRVYPVPGQVDSLLFDNGEQGVERGDGHRENFTLKYGGHSTAAHGKKMAIGGFIGNMALADKPVFLVYPIPETGLDITRFNFRTYLARGAVDGNVSTAFAAYKQRNRFVEAALNDAAGHANVRRIEPAQLLCDTYVKGRCVVQLNGIPLYYDDDHLSNAGSAMVVDEIVKHLAQ
ncbi:MAG: acyltransferase family protein [Pseudomonadota bacterium]